MIILITGGVKSGKSGFGIKLAEGYKQKKKLYFLATAQALDPEMEERIQIHKKSRVAYWKTIEESLDLESALKEIPDKSVVLIECLTLWLCNLITKFGKEIKFSDIEKRIRVIISLINEKKLTGIFITNEVGWGIIPDNEMSRVYEDHLGKINQITAKAADEVYLMVSGISMKIKGRTA